MKTQLNETGKKYALFSSMGIAFNKVDFQRSLKIPMSLGLAKIVDSVKEQRDESILHFGDAEDAD